MGHIELASPVAHLWFLKGTPSRIAMGIAIAGGLTFATFMTLFIVPAAYSFFAGKVEVSTSDASKMA